MFDHAVIYGKSEGTIAKAISDVPYITGRNADRIFDHAGIHSNSEGRINLLVDAGGVLSFCIDLANGFDARLFLIFVGENLTM